MAISLPTEQFRHYIGGELIKGKGKGYFITCPGTEEQVAKIALADQSQAIEALKAAYEAFPKWSELSLEKRGEWINKLIDAIVDESYNLANLLLLESGKLRSHCAFETDSLINYLNYFYEQAKFFNNEIIRDTTGGKGMYLAIREPLGVVFAALAWNFPLHNLATKLGPILASGCTAVIKPATKTPLSTMYFGEIMERIDFPKGVINFVTGDAKEIGKILCESKIPNMVTMIGSTSGGLKMVKDSATSVKKFSMELGGNAPVIVMPDADLYSAVSHTIGNKMRCAGQTCVSPQRAFIHESVYEEFLKMAVNLANNAKCGSIDEEQYGANTGALISFEAVKRMEDIVADAVSKGAIIECGGKSPEYKARGYYFLPTILTNVSTNMRAFKEEIFGPILTIMPYGTIEQAIELANDTEYGLSSYIWGNNYKMIERISRGLKFGIININGPGTGPSQPHGGCKNSGIGKDGSRYSLEEYYYIKNLRISL